MNAQFNTNLQPNGEGNTTIVPIYSSGNKFGITFWIFCVPLIASSHL